MKTIYLLIISLPFLSVAQSFDATNEAAIGSLASLHLCDSNANIQANIMGANATWDFSQIAGVFGVTKDVQMLDATQDANFQTFFSSTPNGRTSQGFVFNEVSLGAVIASWNVDQENVMSYPFAYGNNVNDVFSGTVTSTATGTLPATGTSYAAIDGSGTLLLPGGNSYSNVLRYHLKDSAVASVFGTNVAFVRDVFEYYDFTVGNLPLFITMSVDVNSALLTNNSTMILSKDQPTSYVGSSELSFPAVTLYPNPVTNHLQLSGVSLGDAYRMVTLTGKTIEMGSYQGTIDVTNVNAGVYFIQINGQTVEFIK
jgi:hypothetical protein